MAKTSPTARSLKYLREQGWTACVVEKWIPPRGTMKFGRRIDAFGFGDILACMESKSTFDVKSPSGEIYPELISDGEIALVQTTVMARMAEHKRNILAIPEFRKWKDSGGQVILHGWRKIGPRGKRKTWQVSEDFL